DCLGMNFARHKRFAQLRLKLVFDLLASPLLVHLRHLGVGGDLFEVVGSQQSGHGDCLTVVCCVATSSVSVDAIQLCFERAAPCGRTGRMVSVCRFSRSEVPRSTLSPLPFISSSISARRAFARLVRSPTMSIIRRRLTAMREARSGSLATMSGIASTARRS